MEDWDVDQQRRPAANRPVLITAVLLIAVVLTLLAVAVGAMLRADQPANPFAAPAATGASQPAGIGADPALDAERDAAAEEAAELLFGDALRAGDPYSLNLSLGQTAILHNSDAEVAVTPGRVTAGTGPCAAGPLLTVAVSVRVTRGAAGLAPSDFALLGRDGSVVRAVEKCSSGFVEAAQERTVVFAAAAQPERLVYGPDPEHPIARWYLT
ncbi:hypothetical protein [Actinoplanes sp. NPDC049599]|uniref:hypothetical protein n=1 Tax=Actinoplanes sp. NPDC049599 TaxID=3363903 RepID=UPI0037B04768